MFLSRRISMLLLLISFFYGLQADFFALSVWERATDTGIQHLVLLGDRHDLFDKADEQSDDFINWLEQRNNPHDVVLTEDIAYFGYVIEQAKKYFKRYAKNWDESCLQDIQVRYHDEYFASEASALSEVGRKLAKKGIRSFNCDFRICEPETFTCLDSDWVAFLGSLNRFVEKQILDEVHGYDDCPFLNHYYQALSFSSYSAEREIKKMKEGADESAFFLDARLLHNIFQEQISQECENVVVVCAGAWHTWNIEKKLP